MLVRVGADESVKVVEGLDCRSLSISSECTAEATGRLLIADGLAVEAGPDAAWLDVEQLRRRARPGPGDIGEPRVLSEWDSSYDRMIAYAGERGWLTPSGTAVRAHLELVSPPGPAGAEPAGPADLEFLQVESRGQIAIVTMDRPKVNAVTQPMYEEIQRFFADVPARLPQARTIVLTGAGRHFCGGNDLNEFVTMTPQNAGPRMKQVREAFFAIRDCPVPVIAAVRGVALGTGLALAASCDLVVAANDAQFGLPEVSVGVMGGAKHLSRLVPQGVVRSMFLTADPVRAEDLAGYGGIAAVVPPERVLPEALALAERIVRHSPVTLRFAKQELNEIEYLDIKTGYEYEQGLSGELSAYDDAKEAVRAFFERRAPEYTGR